MVAIVDTLKRKLGIRPNDGEGNTLLPATEEHLPRPNPALLYHPRQTECTDAPQYENIRWQVDCETETDAELEDTFGYHFAKSRAKYVNTGRRIPFNLLTHKERVARFEERMDYLDGHFGFDVVREGVVTYRAVDALTDEGWTEAVRETIENLDDGDSHSDVSFFKFEEEDDDLVVRLKWVDGVADSPQV